MAKLTRSDLYSLEKYSEIRNEFRKKIIAHKEHRRVLLGEHLLLLFEDRLIMQYQVQEMLKAEKIFDAAGIEEELDAYNPLIPDGRNWKATMMIQYEDLEQRKTMLSQLIGIEDKVYMQVDGFDKVFAIADEDISRDNAEKTSAVHFLRLSLTSTWSLPQNRATLLMLASNMINTVTAQRLPTMYAHRWQTISTDPDHVKKARTWRAFF